MSCDDVILHDNRRVKAGHGYAEFLAVTFCQRNDSYRPYIVSLNRYCVPGRVDSYTFDFTSGSDGTGPRIRFFTDTNLSLPAAVRMAQRDFDLPQITEMLIESVRLHPKYGNTLAVHLMHSISPRSKTVRLINRELKQLREQNRLTHAMRHAYTPAP